VHRTGGSAIRIEGGAVELADVLVTCPGADGISWGAGWTGGLTNSAVVMCDEVRGSAAVRGSNDATTPEAEPVSDPALVDITLVGPTDDEALTDGMVLGGGTWGLLTSILVVGFPGAAVVLEDDATFEVLEDLIVLNSLLASDGVWFCDGRRINLEEGCAAQSPSESVEVRDWYLEDGTNQFVRNAGGTLGNAPVVPEELDALDLSTRTISAQGVGAELDLTWIQALGFALE